MATVTYRGTPAEARRRLQDLAAALAGRSGTAVAADVVRGLQLRCGVALLSQVQQAFVVKARGGVGSDGIKWAPLLPQTVKRRRKKGQGGVEILRDTGRLLRSLSPGVSGPSGAEGQVFEVKPGEVTVGTNVEYAEAHQRGNPKRNLPARRLWPEDAAQRLPPAWSAAVAGALRQGVIRAVALLLEREA